MSDFQGAGVWVVCVLRDGLVWHHRDATAMIVVWLLLDDVTGFLALLVAGLAAGFGLLAGDRFIFLGGGGASEAEVVTVVGGDGGLGAGRGRWWWWGPHPDRAAEGAVEKAVIQLPVVIIAFGPL